ncbi:hypothetical protein JTB14_028854 [Gonioctena quinquepunctata]|nr:hypothetical protein JTB14_028854 [Gonioctena quinquepunctata]
MIIRLVRLLALSTIIASVCGYSSNATVPEMVSEEGYPIEIHYVTTSDGYILCLHRIPHGISGVKNDKVAYLQHGILVSSADWVLSGKHRALAYLLADEGYDVWMGNVRGNYYSRNHTKLNPDKDSAFWQFSWHEIGVIDLPCIIDYILNQTEVDGVYYCGHSQGTTVFYVMASMKSEYNKKIKIQVSLSPIAFMNHLFSPLLRLFALGNDPVGTFLELVGVDEFLPSNNSLVLLLRGLCSATYVSKLICLNGLFAIAGFDPNHTNISMVPYIIGHTPAGAATKQLVHYGQEINSGRFCQFDYGPLENWQRYGSLFPPAYDLQKISAPVFLIRGKNDWVSSEIDVGRLSNKLPNVVGVYSILDPPFNHLDYNYAIDAKTIVGDRVINIFSEF